MSASIFSEKMVEPNDKMLAYDLAETKKYLDSIAEFIENNYGNFKPEWKFYNSLENVHRQAKCAVHCSV